MRPQKFQIITDSDLSPWEIEWHVALESTMDRAREAAVAGAGSGTVIVADFQHKGRGTRGRSWIAPSGSCLMFTSILKGCLSSAELVELPTAIAERVSLALREHYDLPVEVDFPNDLTVGGRKLAGVLCIAQTTGDLSDWVLCGIGINTNLAASQVAVENSTSLRIEGGYSVEHERLLGWILQGLDVFRRD